MIISTITANTIATIETSEITADISTNLPPVVITTAVYLMEDGEHFYLMEDGIHQYLLG